MATTYELKGSKWVIEKDPNEVLDYPFFWGDVMTDLDDTISAVEFLVDDDLTIVAQAFNGVSATVWVSGGGPASTSGVPKRLFVTCRVTTSSTPPRVIDQTIWLEIRDH